MFRSLIVFATFISAFIGPCRGQLTLPTLDLQQNLGSTMVWLTPKQGQNVPESAFFTQPGIVNVLGVHDEMQLLKVRQGSGGITHRHYQQRHGGLEVEGAMFATHELGGLLRSANGQLAYLPSLDDPGISGEDAVYVVQTRLGMLAPIASEGDDYIVPDVDLIYAPTTWETGGMPLQYRLAYRVGMVVVEPYSSTTSYVDAITGEIFRLESAMMECSAGNGATLYNGWQAINTKLYNFLGTHYELRDECRGERIHTRIDNHVGNYTRFYKHSQCDDVKDGDNIWSSPDDLAPVSLHWAAEMYWDYLVAKLGRNGLNDSGGVVKLVYHPTVLRVYAPNNGSSPDTISPFNAQWEPKFDESHFGRGDGLSPWVSLDIVSHELTHGLIDQEMSGMLTGGPDAKALNESFADIFSVCNEWYTFPLYDPGRTPNFTIGEDVALGPIRSMSEPWSFFTPRAFQGAFWDGSISPEPHRNSAVQTYWFYLLAFGSAGKPVEGNATVCGIGMDKAANIAYRSITDYMQTGVFYLDARNAAINSAIDIFGLGSHEVTQCTNAWAAVGIGNGSNFCSPVAIETPTNVSLNEMDVYPNPASSEFNVTLNLKGRVLNGCLALWSNSGIKIADIQIPAMLGPGSHFLTVNCGNMPPGRYQLLFSTKDFNLCKSISIIR